MKEKFKEIRFKRSSIDIINKANNILSDYESQGYDLSLRQLYYQFVSRNWLQNTERNYKGLGDTISAARLAGLIDWDMIRDRGRITRALPHWDSPKSILESCAEQFRVDKWSYQDNHVEVMVEKQALEGVLIPVCNELDIPFTANKGYTSSSALYETKDRLIRRIESGKEAHVIYMGDHDPSGIDMSRDVEDRLRLFLGDMADNLTVHRVALNIEQVRELNPPENPAKMTDKRAASYVKKFGKSSWELDAIEPRKLASLVRNKVIELRDESAWEDAVAIEDRGREAIKIAAKNIDKKKGKKK